MNFIGANLAAANKLAGELHNPVQNVLGLSAEETNYGNSPIAVNAHNFFGLHAGAPGSVGVYTTLAGAKAAEFPSANGFFASGQSFVDLFKNAVSGLSDPTAFARALVKAGFNAANSKFVPLVTGSIGAIRKRLSLVGSRHYARGRMIAQSYTTATYFLHANHLHSDTQLTDQSGAVKMDLLYYPWGQIWTKAGSLLDAHFAGFQQGAGIFYTTPTRSYSNTQGRWLSPDPVAGSIPNPQSLNRYAYVMNNAATLIDPLGLFPGHAGPRPARNRNTLH